MQARLNFFQHGPEAMQAMAGLERRIASSGLEQSLLVGHRRGQRGAGVAEPPEVVVVGDAQEGAVQVGVVIHLDVAGAADRQPVLG